MGGSLTQTGTLAHCVITSTTHALVVGEVAREGDDGGEAEEEDQRVELQGLEGDARGGARRPDLERQQPEAECPRKGAVRLPGKGVCGDGETGCAVRSLGMDGCHAMPCQLPAWSVRSMNGGGARTMMKEKSPSETSFQTTSDRRRKPIQAVMGEFLCFPSIRIMRSTCMFMLPPLHFVCVYTRVMGERGVRGVDRFVPPHQARAANRLTCLHPWLPNQLGVWGAQARMSWGRCLAMSGYRARCCCSLVPFLRCCPWSRAGRSGNAACGELWRDGCVS